MVEVEENAVGEIDDVVVIEDTVEADAAPEAEPAAADAGEPEADSAA